MPLLLVLFIVVPLVELYVLIQVGQEIGALNTIALLLLSSVLGTLMLRSQGRAAWRRFQAAIASGRPPTREVADGALIILGGSLLLTPGFVTDVGGLVLLVPPSRALVRGFLARTILARAALVVGGPAGAAGAEAYRRRRRDAAARDRDADVEGSATEVDPERRELP